MTQIMLRRGSAAAWAAADPILALGEVGVETDTMRSKVGDGVSFWSQLSYWATTWSDVVGRPAVVAAGADEEEARASISAAGLDGAGVVFSHQLPSYVDDVVEFADVDAFPQPGEPGKIYISVATGGSWRWTGSQYTEIIASPGTTDAIVEGSTNLWFTSERVDARIAAAVTDGVVVGVDAPATLTQKTLTNPTVNGYTEGVVAIGSVTTSHTLELTSGTVQTVSLTAGTECVFTMPPLVAGKSFVLLVRQAAGGGGSAVFTGVVWAGSAPAVTADAGSVDVFSFLSDGANWFGSAAQGFVL